MKIFALTAWLALLLVGLGAAPALAQDDVRTTYQEYAEACRTRPGTDGSNPCRDALWYYGGHISLDDLHEPLNLMWENCQAGGRITGCAPLHSFYAGNEQLFADGTRRAWPPQPDKALKAIELGCTAVLEGVGNCGSLGLHYEEAGDFTAAGRAYAMGCETGMRAAAGEFFGQDRVCYWAAKNARDNLQDHARARRWFAYTCETGEDAFACKFLGLMFAQGEGGEADPLRALDYYGRGCNMVEDIAIGDGQSCLFFGQSLMAQHARITPEEESPGYRKAMPEDGTPEDLSRQNLIAASRAFLRGCMDGRAEACTAHADLLAAWSRGEHPRRAQSCRIMDAKGRMGPEKLCQRFGFYLAPPEGLADQSAASIFIWPDGDRTVTYDHQGGPA